MSTPFEATHWQQPNLKLAVHDLTDGFHSELNQPPQSPPTDGHRHPDDSGLGTEVLMDVDSGLHGALLGGLLMGLLSKDHFFQGLAIGAIAGVAGYEFLSREVFNGPKSPDTANGSVNPGHATVGALDWQQHLVPGDSKNQFTIVDKGRDLIHRPIVGSI